jgi:chorismate dehydratase
MNQVRLGAVGYLNARPLVFGLDQQRRIDLRFDVPSRCATLLHDGEIDVGLIPSIEYLRDPGAAGSRVKRHPVGAGSRTVVPFGDEPGSADGYRIVPDLAIASRGPVASVALYTTKPMTDVRSIAMDTSSRTSVALVRVLCARHFKIDPALDEIGPNLQLMLERCDAALMIGDNALFTSGGPLTIDRRRSMVEKIDLGEVWTAMTGLPFVWAFWAGRPDALTHADIELLTEARNAGVKQSESIARDYFAGSSNAEERQRVGAKYLRDNIKYGLGPDERAGLELFFRYAAETGVAPTARPLRFY